MFALKVIAVLRSWKFLKFKISATFLEQQSTDILRLNKVKITSKEIGSYFEFFKKIYNLVALS